MLQTLLERERYDRNHQDYVLTSYRVYEITSGDSCQEIKFLFEAGVSRTDHEVATPNLDDLI
jgi:hypothetical protein